jgi:hypothetical protein
MSDCRNSRPCLRDDCEYCKILGVSIDPDDIIRRLTAELAAVSAARDELADMADRMGYQHLRSGSEEQDTWFEMIDALRKVGKTP